MPASISRDKTPPSKVINTEEPEKAIIETVEKPKPQKWKK